MSYLLSFIYVGIYWNNHHHLMQLSASVTGGILWANLHLLFWLALIPFFTRWMDKSGFARVPVLVYGLNLMLAAVAFSILQYALLRREGTDSRLAGYAAVAALWLIPNRRMENLVGAADGQQTEAE
ncbi:putative membrane protein [Arthrobacter sp. UYP6]